MKTIQELLQARKKALDAGRAILTKAREENRALNAEEEEAYDKAFAEAIELRGQVDLLEREERTQAEERELEEREERGRRGLDDGPEDDPESPTNPYATREYRAAFRSWLRRGMASLPEPERRALSVGSDIEGGFTVAPTQMVQQILKDVDDMVFIREKATKFQIPQAQSLGAPRLESDPADADWTSELATGNEDSSMAFGKRTLTPHPLAKRIKASTNFLRQSGPAGENFVRSRLAYKFGITFEKQGMTGDGNQKPLGVFVASTNGISTSRDVSADNTATAVTADGLINAKYSLKAAYWPNAEWMFHRDGMKQVSKLQDGAGQYVFQESLRSGQPDRLLGLPFNISEYVPNTFTTGLYVGIVGDFSHYWIADAMDLQIQRLVELYAETNQIGFIGRLESDGMPVTEEAFVRVKLA